MDALVATIICAQGVLLGFNFAYERRKVNHFGGHFHNLKFDTMPYKNAHRS